MPKRTDISSIMIIGAGPIIIGQACEFDYSGAQACKALREEGYRVILVNSNPATIMTDPGLADATYIEPITPETVAKIIETERPDALLPTMGGQTGLNTALAVADMGVLEKYGVELIGANRKAIEMAEDRKLFREAMDRLGIENPKATIANNMDECMAAIDFVGLPAIIRPAYTLGGTGGGVAYNRDDYIHYCKSGLDASPVSQILIDESLLGWKEFEMEVVRDRADNAIIVCSIENVDPMGVHTGDSITVAPALTLTDKEYQMMRNGSIAVLREIGVETGGSNVQWAVNPADGRMVVIEMNPRVSRSSALASKATGFPIARIAAKLAVGYTLDELDNDITRVTPASLRAQHRLRGHENPALRLREIPRQPAAPDHRDEIGGRGDGHRSHRSTNRCKRRFRRWRPASRASTRWKSRGPQMRIRARRQSPAPFRSPPPTGCAPSRRPCATASRMTKSIPPPRSTRGSSPASARSSRPKSACAATACR